MRLHAEKKKMKTNQLPSMEQAILNLEIAQEELSTTIADLSFAWNLEKQRIEEFSGTYFCG